MPTKIFTILDATLFSQTITGQMLVVSSTNTVTQLYSDLVSGVGIGTVQFLADAATAGPSGAPFNNSEIWNGNPAGTTSHILNQQIDMDYTKVLTGLPLLARIKKMVTNFPCSVNATAFTTGSMHPTPSVGTLRLDGDIRVTVNGAADFKVIDEGQVFAPDLTLTIADTLTGTAADYIVFDLTAGETYITLGDFVTDYSRIKVEFFAGMFCINANSLVVDVVFSSSLENTWTITVTYEEGPLTWTLESPPANRAIQPGDTIRYSSTGADAMDFSQITSIEVNGTPVTQFNIVTPTEYEWVMPDYEEPEDHTVETTITGTQFSGTRELQPFTTVEFENAPGIYTFVDGRTHDTYYDWDSDPVGTIDTKIPNPTGRTGFY